MFHEGNYPLAGPGLGDLEYSLTSEEKEEMQMTSSVPGTCCVPGLKPDFFFFFFPSQHPGLRFTDGEQGKQIGLTPCQILSLGCSVWE